MSIYWAPDNDEQERPPSRTAQSFGREIAVLLFERELPWHAREVGALIRRIWASGPARIVPAFRSVASRRWHAERHGAFGPRVRRIH